MYLQIGINWIWKLIERLVGITFRVGACAEYPYTRDGDCFPVSESRLLRPVLLFCTTGLMTGASACLSRTSMVRPRYKGL